MTRPKLKLCCGMLGLSSLRRACYCYASLFSDWLRSSGDCIAMLSYAGHYHAGLVSTVLRYALVCRASNRFGMQDSATLRFASLRFGGRNSAMILSIRLLERFRMDRPFQDEKHLYRFVGFPLLKEYL